MSGLVRVRLGVRCRNLLVLQKAADARVCMLRQTEEVYNSLVRGRVIVIRVGRGRSPYS